MIVLWDCLVGKNPAAAAAAAAASAAVGSKDQEEVSL
jgi:hypothetical protein